MSDDLLLVEQQDHIATLTINRPEKRNALNPEIHAGLVHHIDRFADEGEVRCLIIKGQGELAFSAGDDLIRAPGEYSDRGRPVGGRKYDSGKQDGSCSSQTSSPLPTSLHFLPFSVPNSLTPTIISAGPGASHLGAHSDGRGHPDNSL